MINELKAYAYCNSDISLIENYYIAIADPNETWHCHHKMGEYMSKEELMEYDWYYNCPPDCLIFLTNSEHGKRHKFRDLGTRTKNSEALKGKHKTFSNEHRNKLAEFAKKNSVGYNNPSAKSKWARTNYNCKWKELTKEQRQEYMEVK